MHESPADPASASASTNQRPAALPHSVRIQTADFDLGAEVAALRAADAGIGAVVSFVGTVRDCNDGQSVGGMALEHYPGMTEKAIAAMVDAAFARFELRGATVIHRVGPLAPLDQVVLVAVSSSHRHAAFEACEFLMDYLKTQAPFWKKEFTSDGAHWVDARASDDAALRRWGLDSRNSAPPSPKPDEGDAASGDSAPAEGASAVPASAAAGAVPRVGRL